MSDDNDGARGKGWLDEGVQTISYAHVTELEKGSFREHGEGEQYSEIFWADAVETTLHQTHPRVSTLKTQLVCQYKFENGRIYVKTLRYHMTSRPADKYWYRANIDVGLQAGQWVRKNSQDSMSQDNQWHNYEIYLDSPLGVPDFGVSLAIRVDYDGTNNDVEPHEGWGINIYPSRKPIIELPASNAVVEMPFAVSGINGLVWPFPPTVYGKVNLLCIYNGQVIPLGSGTVGRDGRWGAYISLPPDVTSFYAEQLIGDQNSGRSESVSIRRAVAAPVITVPTPNSTVSVRRPYVEGTGTASALVRIYQAGSDAILYGQTVVRLDGVWSLMLQHDLPDGVFTFTAKQSLGGVDSPWARYVPVTVRVLPKTPAITSPTANTLQSSTFTVSGSGGEAGAKVDVLLDIAGTRVGQSATLTGDAWSASVTVSPGPVSLVAKQIKGQLESLLSAPRAFKVRPPALTAVTATPIGTHVKLTGSGHTGATVQITVVDGGAAAPPAVQVTNGRWETTAANWPFGTYRLRAIQKVSDNAGGWIESQPYTFTVNHTFPNPSDVAFTADYQPTCSGKGLNGATVRLFDVGGTVPLAPDAIVGGGQWSVRVSQVWGPTWERSVQVKQFLGEQASNGVTDNVTIAPKVPTLDAPVEDGLSPQWSGTCWPGATVNIEFSDSTTVHKVIGAGGVWSYRRATDFAPGIIYTVKVTQTAASQTSAIVSRTFTVDAPLPKPVITFPAQNAEVGTEVTVRGESGVAGATMQLRDAQFGRPLGTPKTLTSDGAWFIDLTALEFRQYTLDARQARNGRESERSDLHIFRVVLLPPVFEAPEQGGTLPRTAILSGTAMPGGKVEVLLEGDSAPLLKDITVDAEGRWQGEVSLPVGPKTLRARQTFESLTSRDSPPLAFSVVPAAPFIETPVTGEPVGRRAVVSGFGVPGDTVSVSLAGANRSVSAQAPVLGDRTWSVTLLSDLPGGDGEVTAVASFDGFESAGARRRVVLATFLPGIDLPAPGQWVVHPVLFKGQGQPGSGQVTSWFDPEQAWTAVMPVTAAGWQGSAAQAVPPGGQWCRFRQTLTGGAAGPTMSDWQESERFEALPPQATRS